MRISDWSSDVCSSDLRCRIHARLCGRAGRGALRRGGRHPDQPGGRRALFPGQPAHEELAVSAVTDTAGPASDGYRSRSRAWRKLKTSHSALAGFAIVAFFVVLALLAPMLPIDDPTATRWSAVRKARSEEHTSELESLMRDVFSRMIWGARASLIAGLLSVIMAVSLGVPLGLEIGSAHV